MPARRLIVLLRGVNLARNRRLAMADLRRLLEQLGYEDAVTHGQSGNAVLTTTKAPATVKRELEQRIAADLGLETEVFVRTRDELADVIARDPFAGEVDNPSRYQVSFLSKQPSARAARELESADVAPERVAVSGKELYAWHPNGLQRSPLARLLTEQRLGVGATARNWNTVTKLLALADG
jgi:uncharacterized protein (DUF1697 family)